MSEQQLPITASDNFYRAFEDRYRGARELIKTRLMAYQPFFSPLASAYPGGHALDLGCGRGEWLELLGEQGFKARGVDLDEGMLAACRERRLDVTLTDALSALRAAPAASLVLVSAFHLIEHIPFEMVQDLIMEANRALVPGGLLIMETPNPENLVVGASSFYMDPSHLRPVPSQLLDFVVSYRGFARHKVVRLQESHHLHDNGAIGLIDVLDGVSPDYAVIGQKAAPDALLAPFEHPFAASYGIALADLAQRYERQEDFRRGELHQGLARIDARLNRDAATLLDSLDNAHKGLQRVAAGVEHNRQQIDAQHAAVAEAVSAAALAAATATAATESRLSALSARLLQAETVAALHALRLETTEQQLSRLHGEQAALQVRTGLAEGQARQHAERVEALLASSSWRLTAPLRWLSDGGRRTLLASRQGRLGTALRRRVKGPLIDLMRAVLRRPRLKRAARSLLARLPRLQARLRQLMQHNAYHATATSHRADSAAPPAASSADLSPRALDAYHQLKQIIKTTDTETRSS